MNNCSKKLNTSSLDESDRMMVIRFLSDQEDHEFITQMFVPPHPKSYFDEKLLLKRLANNVNFLLEDKLMIIENIQKFTQFQINKICDMLQNEILRFIELVPEVLDFEIGNKLIEMGEYSRVETGDKKSAKNIA